MQWEAEQFALRSINLLYLFGIRRSCLRSGRSRSLYVSIRRAIKRIVVVIAAYHFRQLHTKFYPTYCCYGYLNMQKKLLGIINVDFESNRSTTDHIFYILQILEENGNQRSSVSFPYRLQEILMIQLGGISIILLSLRLVSPWNQ